MDGLCHSLRRLGGSCHLVASPCAARLGSGECGVSALVIKSRQPWGIVSLAHACHLYCNVLLADIISSCVTEHHRLKNPQSSRVVSVCVWVSGSWLMLSTRLSW